MAEKVLLGIHLEELVEKFPEAVGFLTRHGVRCIRCGEPLWCTLGELLDEVGIDKPQHLVYELNNHIQRERKKAKKKK